jgi:lipopolysaccharide transport system permease protein
VETTTSALKATPTTEKELISTQTWTEVIEPRANLLDLRLGDVWRYRDLIMMFVRRDFIATYKQTILGPLWFFIQPILTTITFTIIFGKVANLGTEGVPMPLFYLAGLTVWNYFSTTLTSTSNVFLGNAHIFGKVYFPRLTMPISIVISNLIRFSIQFALFLGMWVYYLVKQGNQVHPNGFIALTPVLLLIMGLLSLGFGMIFSALTTKYRDLGMLLGFGMQLWMYATPIIYPLSKVPVQYQWIIRLNPLTPIVETFRYAFLGAGSFSWLNLGYSALITLIILFLGTIIFNKVEKSFMDTV